MIIMSFFSWLEHIRVYAEWDYEIQVLIYDAFKIIQSNFFNSSIALILEELFEFLIDKKCYFTIAGEILVILADIAPHKAFKHASRYYAEHMYDYQYEHDYGLILRHKSVQVFKKLKKGWDKLLRLFYDVHVWNNGLLLAVVDTLASFGEKCIPHLLIYKDGIIWTYNGEEPEASELFENYSQELQHKIADILSKYHYSDDNSEMVIEAILQCMQYWDEPTILWHLRKNLLTTIQNNLEQIIAEMSNDYYLKQIPSSYLKLWNYLKNYLINYGTIPDCTDIVYG